MVVLLIPDHECESSGGKRSDMAERDTRSGVFQALNGKLRGYSVPSSTFLQGVMSNVIEAQERGE